MNLYQDDNIADRSLAAALRRAGHTVSRPADFGLAGASDPRHFERAIRENLVLLTKDNDDFQDLHNLVLASGGRHPGLVVVRLENDARRDMKTKHIVAALRRLEQAGIPLGNQWVVLNQWR
jgi:predicted nuclease of predicted toxin-antitoxin system